MMSTVNWGMELTSILQLYNGEVELIRIGVSRLILTDYLGIGFIGKKEINAYFRIFRGLIILLLPSSLRLRTL